MACLFISITLTYSFCQYHLDLTKKRMFLVLKNSLVPMTLTCRMYFQKYLKDLGKDSNSNILCTYRSLVPSETTLRRFFFLSFKMFVLDIFGFCDKRLIEIFCLVHLQWNENRSACPNLEGFLRSFLSFPSKWLITQIKLLGGSLSLSALARELGVCACWKKASLIYVE